MADSTSLYFKVIVYSDGHLFSLTFLTYPSHLLTIFCCNLSSFEQKWAFYYLLENLVVGTIYNLLIFLEKGFVFSNFS